MASPAPADYSSVSRSRSRSRSRATTANEFDRQDNALAVRVEPVADARALGPALDPADRPLVESLVNELVDLTRTHARFAERTQNELLSAATDFVRYRFRSLDAVKRATKEARRYFLDDLRKVERKAFPELSLIIELFDHLPVNIQNEQADDKVRYTEIDIPRALGTLTPSLAAVSGLLRPDQRMCERGTQFSYPPSNS